MAAFLKRFISWFQDIFNSSTILQYPKMHSQNQQEKKLHNELNSIEVKVSIKSRYIIIDSENLKG